MSIVKIKPNQLDIPTFHACKYATNSNITLSDEQDIDGTTTSFSRVLVKDQTNKKQNGIYTTSAGSWVRVTDFDSITEYKIGTQVFVLDGTINGGTFWVLTGSDVNDNGIIDNTIEDLVFTKIGGGGTDLVGTINEIDISTNAISLSDDIVKVGGKFNGLTFKKGTGEAAQIGTGIAVGTDKTDEIPEYCVSIGHGALRFFSTDGDRNVAIGHSSMIGISGQSTGTTNVALGAYTLSTCTSGYRNVALGDSALTALTTGNNNIAIGYSAASAITTGTNNIVIGDEVGTTTTTNKTYIGYDSTTNTYLKGEVSGASFVSNSSIRYKYDVETIQNSLSTVEKLRGVSFKLKSNNAPHIGLIAEEVFEVLPEVVSLNDNGEPDSVNYSAIVGLLVEAIKELKHEISLLKGV